MDIFGRGGGKTLAEEAQVPFLGEIPMDPQVRQSGDSGLPVVLSHPESDASQAFFTIAEILAARLSPDTEQ
jgi:ATP-binding protein involved in chromosome partitioning